MRAYDLAGKRKAAGVQQIALGAELGVSQEVVRAIELGRVEITDAEYARWVETIERMGAGGSGQ